MRASRVLLLGGTGEARRLAGALAGDARVDPIVSLAGVTSETATLAGAVRRGGFGGADGLARYIEAERIDIVVDATHPFAAKISVNARAAAAATGRSYLRLERPPWSRAEGDAWRDAASAEVAAAMIPPGATAFLALGSGGLAPFIHRAGGRLVARMIAPPAGGLPAIVTPIYDRGPFHVDAEMALFRRQRIDVLVTKNSGGADTEAKLLAARRLRLPVIMIARPAGQPKPDAASVEEMLALLEPHLA